MAGKKRPGRSITASPKGRQPENIPLWSDYRAAREKEYLTVLMRQCEGDIQQACRLSGLSRSRLYQLLRNYDVS